MVERKKDLRDIFPGVLTLPKLVPVGIFMKQSYSVKINSQNPSSFKKPRYRSHLVAGRLFLIVNSGHPTRILRLSENGIRLKRGLPRLKIESILHRKSTCRDHQNRATGFPLV